MSDNWCPENDGAYQMEMAEKARREKADRIEALEAEVARLRAAMEWQPIETAPRDGKSILLFTKCHGVCEAWYSPGSWSDEIPGVTLAEYDGPVWVCCDDAFTIEIEEGCLPGGMDHHGTATHWMPLPAAPKGEV